MWKWLKQEWTLWYRKTFWEPVDHWAMLFGMERKRGETSYQLRKRVVCKIKGYDLKGRE